MSYVLRIRRNGKDAGQLGPYEQKGHADADAKVITIQLKGDAEVVVEKVYVGATRYRPAIGAIPAGGGKGSSSEPEWKKHAKTDLGPSGPSSGGMFSTSGGKPKWKSGASSFGGQDDPFAGLPQHKYGPPPEPYVPKPSYGTVAIDGNGMVLIREPANHFDGYAWTFPKGGQDKGETATETALRETLEETGWQVQIVAPLPGKWGTESTKTGYFLAQPVAAVQPTDKETWTVDFVTYHEAKLRLAMTKKQKGRERDLEVLDVAFTLWASMTGHPNPVTATVRPNPRPLYR